MGGLEEIKKTKELRLKNINNINWSIKKKLGLIDGNKIFDYLSKMKAGWNNLDNHNYIETHPLFAHPQTDSR